MKELTSDNINAIQNIKLVLTDCDGVLTDNGVYYSSEGEQLKRFSIRDGMGVERLRKLLDIETGIITGETSGSVKKRAEKLQLKFLYLGIKDKKAMFNQILTDTGFHANQIGYIGDDVNDLEIMSLCGFTACPGDAMFQVKTAVNYICINPGGHGAFREFAELIIQNKNKK